MVDSEISEKGRDCLSSKQIKTRIQILKNHVTDI